MRYFVAGVILLVFGAGWKAHDMQQRHYCEGVKGIYVNADPNVDHPAICWHPEKGVIP